MVIIPYHLVDPTSQPNKISSGDLDDVTRVDDNPSGLAHARELLDLAGGAARSS